MNRRRFLACGVLAGAVVTITGCFGKVTAQSDSSRLSQNKSGTVLAIDGDIIHTSSFPDPITAKFNSTTRIWKGEDGVAISAIRVGDEIAMRGFTDIDGSFVPSEVWVNIVSLDGIIASVDGPIVDVQVVPHGDDYVSEVRRIRLSNKTLSSEDIPLKYDHVQVGRVVRVIGLVLEDGTIQAYRVTMYVNGRPVDSLGRRYVDPLTGRISDKP